MSRSPSGERAICELESIEQKRIAASDAQAWGFPREILPPEISDSYWFRLGTGVVFWYERVPHTPDLWIHLAIAPHLRSRWPVRTWVRESESIARKKGANCLRYLPFGDERDFPVVGYLTRIGWLVDEFGLFKSLGVRNG